MVLGHRRMFTRGLAVVALLAALSGCASRNMQVGLAPQLTQKAAPNVTVHLIGVHPSNLDNWKAMSVSSYWDTQSALRDAAVRRGTLKEVKLGGRESNTYTLQESDPIWGTWKQAGCKYVVVLTDMPRSVADPSGDPRRLVFPLEPDGKPRGPIVLQIDGGGLNTIKG